MNFSIVTIREIIVVLVPMILSLSVHEYAHAWSAYKLGDDTAASAGRLTLNPLVHIDLFGTFLIPIGFILSGGHAMFGWAKPVPVSPQRFNRNITMHRGMILTALAGPASNILLAFLVGGIVTILAGDKIAALTEHLQGGRIEALLALGSERFVEVNSAALAHLGIEGFDIVLMLLGRVFVLNVALAVFNMLPVPPLDGSRILPFSWQAKISRYSFVVLILFFVMIYQVGDLLWVPIKLIGNLLLGFFGFFF